MFNNSSIKLDLEKLGWYIWISILSFVFAIFALIYRPEFVYYGFATLAYGHMAWLVDTAFHNIVKEKENKHWILFLAEGALIGVWIYCIFTIFYWIELNTN